MWQEVSASGLDDLNMTLTAHQRVAFSQAQPIGPQVPHPYKGLNLLYELEDLRTESTLF